MSAQGAQKIGKIRMVKGSNYSSSPKNSFIHFCSNNSVKNGYWSFRPIKLIDRLTREWVIIRLDMVTGLYLNGTMRKSSHQIWG